MRVYEHVDVGGAYELHGSQNGENLGKSRLRPSAGVGGTVCHLHVDASAQEEGGLAVFVERKQGRDRWDEFFTKHDGIII